MTIKINTAMQNGLADLFASQVGDTAAEVRIYTGSQPANANTAASGTLLCTITVSNGWNASSSGVKTIVMNESGTAVATGTAGWARLRDSGDTYRVDGSVGTSGTDFIINSTSIVNAGTVTLTGLTITQPST